MRTVGTILSLLCALIAIGLLLMGYVLFSESPLPEGSGNWIRLEFRNVVLTFALWVLLVLGCVMIPTLGLIRSGKSISSRKVTDWVLFGIAAFYLAFWSWGLAIRLRLPDLDWVLIPLFIMFVGCLYGLLVFWKRARYRIDEEAQQAVDGNPH